MSTLGSDVTKQAEILKKIFDHVPVMMNFIDASGRIVIVNPAWERTLGWSLAEIERDCLNIFALCYPDPEYRRWVIGQAAAATGAPIECRTHVRDGRVIDTSWVVFRFSDGTRVGMGEDVTERNRTRDALRTFSRRLVEVQEAERRHVARELHDEVGQILTGLTLLLEIGPRLHADALTTTLSEAHKLAQDLLGRVRTLSLDLRPPALDDLGLLPALLWHFDRYSAMTGVKVAFQQRGLDGRRFTPEIETAAYRIVQEALTNVARHSLGHEAAVQLTVNEEALLLEIADDGRGFDPDAAFDARSSSGLLGMRERARLLNGQLTVHSAKSAGTRVIATLPLAHD
jgi:PAS domain S-box-containing protein